MTIVIASSYVVMMVDIKIIIAIMVHLTTIIIEAMIDPLRLEIGIDHHHKQVEIIQQINIEKEVNLITTTTNRKSPDISMAMIIVNQNVIDLIISIVEHGRPKSHP